MFDFFASLGVFGWIVLIALAAGLAQLPKALREAWTRPWKGDARKNRPGRTGDSTRSPPD